MKSVIRFLKHIVLVALLLIIIFPILYTVLSSFKTNADIMAHPEMIIPKNPTIANYREVFSTSKFPFVRMFFNSVFYTFASVAITLFISTMCGYVFARGEFRGKKMIFLVFCALMFVNLGSITMYPYFEVLDLLHLQKGLPALLLIKCFGIPVANIYLVKGFIEGIPREIDEAAEVDGLSFVGIFTRIIFPMLKPISATIGLLTFNGSWNDYLNPMIFTMSTPLQRTLTVGLVQLKYSGEAAASWNLMLAGTTVTLIPVLVVYLIGNRYFVEGISAGAVKG